jgi:hypothetical protein
MALRFVPEERLYEMKLRRYGLEEDAYIFLFGK